MNNENNGWQPIETCPRNHDGEVFLMFSPHEVVGFMFAGYFNLDGKWSNNIDHEEENPTHWMPLPAPPKP